MKIKSMEKLYGVRIKKDRKTTLYDLFTGKGSYWGRFTMEDLRIELQANGWMLNRA